MPAGFVLWQSGVFSATCAPLELEQHRVRVPNSSTDFVPTQTLVQAPSLTTGELVQPKPSSEVMLDKVEFSDMPLEYALRLFSQESGLQVVASNRSRI